MSVSLPSTGVTVIPGGCTLIASTVDLPCIGVTLIAGVSLGGGGGGGGTPANGYVAENGVTFYVAEDGATFYVQEM